jgi:pyrroloquinoline quinone biosynthesis protein D
VQLNRSAAEILRRCDGRRSVAQIVSELELAFAQPALHDDVCNFLDEARQRGWLQAATMAHTSTAPPTPGGAAPC